MLLHGWIKLNNPKRLRAIVEEAVLGYRLHQEYHHRHQHQHVVMQKDNNNNNNHSHILSTMTKSSISEARQVNMLLLAEIFSSR